MRIAINGLGRIGRLVLKSGIDEGVNFVAINDLTDPKTLAYLIKYDFAKLFLHRVLPENVLTPAAPLLL